MPVRPAKGCNMNQDERRKYILDQLKIKSSISVSELSEAFSLSEVSVRKLLANMEQEGVLKRTWGGAVSRYGSLREFSHQENEVRHREEKRQSQPLPMTAFRMEKRFFWTAARQPSSLPE